MNRDIDRIIEQVRQRLPDVRVQQHWVPDPRTADDGIWWFYLPGVENDIQIESSLGSRPFLVEHTEMESTAEAVVAHTVDQAVEKIVSYLSRLTDRAG
jgi:hypothetical protein